MSQNMRSLPTAHAHHTRDNPNAVSIRVTHTYTWEYATPCRLRALFYQSIVLPHLDYCAVVWAECCGRMPTNWREYRREVWGLSWTRAMIVHLQALGQGWVGCLFIIEGECWELCVLESVWGEWVRSIWRKCLQQMRVSDCRMPEGPVMCIWGHSARQIGCSGPLHKVQGMSGTFYLLKLEKLTMLHLNLYWNSIWQWIECFSNLVYLLIAIQQLCHVLLLLIPVYCSVHLSGPPFIPALCWRGNLNNNTIQYNTINCRNTHNNMIRVHRCVRYDDNRDSWA